MNLFREDQGFSESDTSLQVTESQMQGYHYYG